MAQSIAAVAIKLFQARRSFTLCFLSLWLCMALPASAQADGPTDQVRGTVDKVLTSVRGGQATSKAQIEAQRAQLAEVIYPRFDFTEMAKRSLGRHWPGRSAEEQREFVALFATLMGKSYADNIQTYTNQTVLYTREREDHPYAEVDTRIVSEKGSIVSVNYKLHNIDKQWKVYDLVIEDISVVNNYRSQFDRVIARSSFTELIRTMKEKQP